MDILTQVNNVWNGLDPGLREPIGMVAQGAAQAFGEQILDGLRRSLRNRIRRSPAEEALNRALQEGIRACMLIMAPPSVWADKSNQKALRRFFEQEDVADEFSALVDVNPDVPLNLERLRALFQEHGGPLADLPDLNFDEAMKAFAAAYADVIERSGAQQHVDQLRYLKQVVARLEAVQEEAALSRTELARIRQIILEISNAHRLDLERQTRVLVEALKVYHAYPQDAVADALTDLRTAIAELSEAVLTTVQKDTEAFRRADLETKETAYRLLIAREFERLDFKGMLQHGQPVTLPLERVYVSLRASRRVPVADTPEAERLRRQLAELEEQLDKTDLPSEEPEERSDKTELPSEELKERRAELERRLEALERSRLQKEAQPVDIKQALADPDNQAMIVLGDPGAGKTTLLKYLALAFARSKAPSMLGLDEERLPIFVPLAFYDAALREQPDLSLGDYLSDYYASEKNLPGLKRLFDSALEEGRAVVLLDGLDEVFSDETRLTVSQRAESLMRTAATQGNRVVLTSRIVGYRAAPLAADLPHFTILDMDPAAVRAFVDRWALAMTCQTRGENFERPTAEAQAESTKLAEGLKAAIEESESVRRLAVNPLLLTILAVVYTQEGMALPRRRVELYHRYVRILIETWRRVRTPGRAVGKEMDFLETAKVLGPLALWLQENWPSGTAPGPRVREFLKGLFLERLGCPAGQRPTHEQEVQAHRQAEQFLKDVREFAGLLVERGRDSYGFLHLTFQEYLAAWQLAKLEPQERRQRLGPHLHDPRWREVVLLTAGHLGVVDANERLVTEFVGSILNARSPLPELHRDLLLAAACLADDVGVRPDLGREIVVRLGELLRSPVPGLAEAAGEALGGLTETQLAEQAAEIAVRVLRNLDSPPWSRQAAASSLGQLGQVKPETIQALTNALWDKDGLVREAAASSLSQLGQANHRVMNALTNALRDSDENVRGAAAFGLGQLGQATPQVAQALNSALRDEHTRVRRAAAYSLVQLGQVNPKVINTLIKDLGDGDEDMREVAAFSMGQLGEGTPRVVQALINALGDSDERVREAAAFSLGRLGQANPNVVQVLVKALANKDWRVRQGATFSLGQLDRANPKVVQTLINALADSNKDVRAAAASSLGQLDQTTPRVVQTLINALADSNKDVRAAAAFSLGELGQAEPKVVGALTSALADSDKDVRAAAAFSLGRLGQAGSKVMQGLSNALGDSNEDVRAAGAFSLGQLGRGKRKVVQALIKALGDSSEDVRQAAAYSLGRLGQANFKVIRALSNALEDKDGNVRQAAAYSLGRLGRANPEVVQALTNALTDSDEDVRQAAYEALLKLAPPYAGWAQG